MGRVMRKPAFCVCENKDAETARLISAFVFATLLPKSKISGFLAIFFRGTAWFVSDLVGNPKDRFSHDAAHMLLIPIRIVK